MANLCHKLKTGLKIGTLVKGRMLTIEQLPAAHAAIDAQAANVLVRGKYYRFNPPVECTGAPTGGPRVCPPEELAKSLQFNRGWYIGYVNGHHVFQGKPVNDPRIIPCPEGYEDFEEYGGTLEEVTEPLRECYYHVAFVGGSITTVDPNQDP